MSRVTVVQRACLAIVATLIAASCGSGTESGTGAPTGGDRNVALAGDNGLPFQGISPRLRRVGIDPVSQRVWTAGHDLSTGLVTGGIALFQTPKFSTLDPTFPRINGIVNDIEYTTSTEEIIVAGQFESIGARGGLVKRRDLAILGPNGLRDTNISFNGTVTSIARIGTKIFVAGWFSYTKDLVSGVTRTSETTTRGFRMIDGITGRLAERQVSLPISIDEGVLELVAGRATGLSAPWLAASSLNFRTGVHSLQIVDSLTGQRVKTILEAESELTLTDAGNGYALVKTGSGSGADPIKFRILNIESQTLSAAIAPAGHSMLSGTANDGRVRLASRTVGNTFWFHDVNPANATVVKTIEVPRTNLFYQDYIGLAWAGDGITMYSNGVAYEHATGRFITVRSPGSGGEIRIARMLGNRGLLVGGVFDTSLETDRSDLISVPADGSLADIRDFGDPKTQIAGLAPTPMGVVALAWKIGNELEAVLLGSDPSQTPRVIARIIGGANCISNDRDIASNGTSVFISGCWESVTVSGTTTTERLIEIDLSGGAPTLVRGYRIGDSAPDQIAVTTNHVFVTEDGNNRRLLALSRSSGVIVGQRDFGHLPEDMLGLRYRDSDVLLLGGQNIVIPRVESGEATLFSMTVNDQSASTLDVRPVEGVSGYIRTMTLGASTADQPDPRYVFLAGAGLEFGPARGSVLQLDLEVGGVEPRMSIEADSLVENVAVHGDKLWAVGLFTSVVSNREVFRAPGMVAYDLTNHRVLMRGAVPLSTTTTTTIAGGTTSTEEDDSITNPIGPTPPPPLPTTGTIGVGTYSVESESGVRSEVRVYEDGTISIAPISGNIEAGRPLITRLVPGSRTVRVSWSTSPGKPVYKVTTGRGKSKRTCTTTKSSCTVKNLDPWRTHVFTVEAVRGTKRASSDMSPRIKPFVKVRKGSATKVSSIAPQGAKGKAVWTTTSPCSVKNGKLVAPKKSGTCTIKVVVGKSVRRVTVRVG